MRIGSILLSAAFLVAGALGARKAPADQFQAYHAKSLSSSPLKLSETSYKALTTGSRDYSVAVLLTALETRFACQLCREFQPEYNLLAKSWTQGDRKAESRLLFGTLDFTDGRDIFISVWVLSGLLVLGRPLTLAIAWLANRSGSVGLPAD